MQELKGVTQSRVTDWGHAIEVDLVYADDSRQTVKIPFSLAPSVMLAIRQSAEIAERTQRAQPGQSVSLEVPVTATDVHAGIGGDGNTFALRFLTTIGTPMVIAMSLDIARRTIELLSGVLENRDKQPPFRPS